MNQPRFRPRTLGLPELLESRQVLSGTTPALFTQSLAVAERTITLVARDDVDLRQQSLELVNPPGEMARFSLTINGHLSRNTAQLAEQIRGMTFLGDEQMPNYLRAYQYLTQFHQHDFPVSTGLWAHEPSFYLNSFGAGLCDDAATVLKLLWEEMGYQSRVWLLNGHVVSEVFTGQRWEMYDADLQVFYRNHAGQVAGVEELVANPDLIYAPVEPTSSNPFVYSGRMASIYSTTENNRVCSVCDDFVVERDLIFTVPGGGRLTWGQTYSQRELPTVMLQTPSKLGQVQLTIPAGFSGSIDIPLALLDVLGTDDDEIRIGDRVLGLGAQEPFDFFNQDQAQGNRFHRLEIERNTQPIRIVFLLNERFVEVLDQNELVIQAENQAANRLVGRVASFVTRRWTTDASQVWSGDAYVDLSGTEVTELLRAQAAFEVRAQLQLEGEATRRPIFDAFRFAFEVDAQNCPYVYYQRASGGWQGLRGEPLPAGDWHELAARYERGALTLEVNGEVVATAEGNLLSETYPLRGPYLGKSDHQGGLFFRGRTEFVQVRDLQAAGDDLRETSVSPRSQFPQNTWRDESVLRLPIGPQVLEVFSAAQPRRRQVLHVKGVDALMAGSYRFA